jgi:hypothetical protein
MFLREVVTNARSGAPVRYAQVLESYRDEQGKSCHRVVLSLGRVDPIDKEKLRGLIASLSRYLVTPRRAVPCWPRRDMVATEAGELAPRGRPCDAVTCV